jgi:hypothetical protein
MVTGSPATDRAVGCGESSISGGVASTSKAHSCRTSGSGEPAVDPAEVGADELGLVPVLMYHQLRDDGGSDWDMTPEEFRASSSGSSTNGYVPITTIELARGEIDVPAGTARWC